jgi:hypothetical protein
LDDGFCGDGAASRAALFVEEIHHFSEGLGIRGIPEVGALAADIDEAHLLQFFKVMRKSRSRDAQFFLDFSGDHSVGMSSKQEAENLEARLRAEGGEAVGGASNQQRIGLPHISIIAEIWNDVKPFLALTLSPAPAS